MSYIYDSTFTAMSYTRGRGGHDIDGIVIHHWGVDGQTHDGVVKFFCTHAGTSAHYVASAGRVTCVVDPDDTAWHAGNWHANQTKIGIECRPEMNEDDFHTVAELIADLRETYGYLPLSPHSNYVSTACPGRWKDQLSKLSQLANQIQKEETTITEVKETQMYNYIAFTYKKNWYILNVTTGTYTKCVDGEHVKRRFKVYKRAGAKTVYWKTLINGKTNNVKSISNMGVSNE